MSKPCCPVKKTANAQFDTSVQLLQSQPPMQMSDCLTEYTTSTNNQQFLQYDNGQKAENRMLVFYSLDSLERLANAQTFFIFMDGTFSVAPHPFKQLYTIRVSFKDVTGTAVYAFLPNKCQDTYRELFQSIVDNCHASNLQFNVQTLKMQSFVQLQLYLVAISTTRAVSTT
jgi:hypothetical protein